MRSVLQKSKLPSRPQNVNFTFTINDVKKVDTENQEMTINMIITIEWLDSRVTCKTEVG